MELKDLTLFMIFIYRRNFMDEVTRTFIDGNGFGGLGAGGTLGLGAIGGLVLGSLWNGNGFGFGGNNGSRGVAYDSGLLTSMQSQVANISNQVANADRDLLMQTANQNQFVGNLINQTGDAIVGAVTTGSQITQNAISNLGQNVQNGIFQNTLTQVQSQGATNLGMCQGFGSVNANISGSTSQLQNSLTSINNNITAQNYENRLQAQQLASQQQQCCCQVLQKIEQEGCANRELQRQIQTEAITTALNDAKAQNAALTAQINLSQQLAASQAAQNAYLINALKPTTTGA